MELYVIEQFLQLAKMEHMTETADFFNVTQPSLSKNIARLEEEVGVKLFDRVGRRIKLNKNGENFAKYAREALAMLNAGKISARTTRYAVQGQIRIHCRAFGPILSKCISEYSELNPMVEFVVSYNGMDSSDLDLEQKDFILCATHPESGQENSGQVWETEELLHERQCIIVAEDCPWLKGKRPTTLKDFEEVPFVTMVQQDIFFKDPTFLFCLDAGFTPRISMRTDNLLVKTEHVKYGRAASFLPESCIPTAKAIAPNLLVIPLENEEKRFERIVYLMHRKESYMTETARDFLVFVKDFFS